MVVSLGKYGKGLAKSYYSLFRRKRKALIPINRKETEITCTGKGNNVLQSKHEKQPFPGTIPGKKGSIYMKNINPEMKRKLIAAVAAIAVMAVFIGGNFFYAKAITTEIPDPEVFFDKKPADTGYEMMTFYLEGDVNEIVFDYIEKLRDDCGLRIAEKEKKAEW